MRRASRSLALLTALLLPLWTAACGGSPTPTPTRAPLPAVTAAPRVASGTPTTSAGLTITGPSGPVVATVARDGGTVTITYATGGRTATLRGTAGSGRRAYARADGEAVGTVTTGDDGFKLQGADGRLRWKVKLEDGRVKIADNEANEHAFTLEDRGADRVKIARDDRELGNVRAHPERGATAVEDAGGARRYECAVAVARPSCALPLLTDIPEEDRFLLLGELVARDR